MAEALEFAGDLPFRFLLSEAMAARWAEVPEYARAKWLNEWLDLSESEYCLSSSLWPSNASSVQVSVRGALQTVRQSCLARSIAYSDMVQAFSVFVTKKLRASKAVRGELELTAEWALATGAEHALEVHCAAGRIDIVFAKHCLLVEAKLGGQWKHALGQALAYKHCLSKDYAAALLLLGKRSDSAYDGRLAEAVASANAVHVFWYDGLQPAATVSEAWQKFTNLRHSRNQGN